jgi:LPS export ABC transporter protein LptC
MDLYGREKSGVLNVRANNAKYNSKTGDVELTGNISAGNRTGMKFTTGRLRYAAARSMISTSDKVTFNDGRLTVTGTGMEFMVRTKTVKLLNNVSASIAPR